MDRTLIDQYEAAPAKVRRAVAGMSEEELRARPGPGQWSTLEVIVHLLDSDSIAIDRMKRILTEDNPPLLYADETAYVARLHPHEHSLEETLLLFEVGRRHWARVLRKLSDADFARKGTHNRRGEVTVGQMVATYIKHVEDHLTFIHGKRERLGKPLAEGAR